MKKMMSTALVMVLILSVAGITGCVNNATEDVTNYNGENGATIDYSRFIGDWEVYYLATTTILQISNIEDNEITFNFVRFGGETNDPRMSEVYTFPITDNQVQFEENNIINDDEWVMQHHTLTFYDDYILWVTDFSSSWITAGGTVSTDEWSLDRQFTPPENWPEIIAE